MSDGKCSDLMPILKQIYRDRPLLDRIKCWPYKMWCRYWALGIQLWWNK